MITRDWAWLITCLQGTEVCVCVGLCVSVYRHASAGLSIHVNMSKTPEGAGVCTPLPALLCRKNTKTKKRS